MLFVLLLSECLASVSFPGQLEKCSDACILKERLKTAPWRMSDRGVIIADVMGLGKTVEAVAAAILRNAIAHAQKKPKKPTLICSPNGPVLGQWRDTLIKAGVDRRKIYRFKTKQSKPVKGGIFVLCTIYDLQTEAKCCFETIRKVSGRMEAHKSPLFPDSPTKLLCVLKNQYKAERGKEKNRHNTINNGMVSVNECIRHFLANYESKCSLLFRTVIIDEAVSFFCPDSALLW